MLTLTLGINPKGWRIFSGRRKDSAFVPNAEKIWQRDNHTCQFCGLRAERYQEIINKDGNYTRHAADNLATACCFCATCLFLDAPSEGEGMDGKILYMPEITQEKLNNFWQVIYSAMISDTIYQETAKSLFHSFRHRTQEVERIFGTGASEAPNFGHVLNDMQATTHANYHTILSALRYMPSRTKYKTQIEYWASTVFEDMDETWDLNDNIWDAT
jgi:intracellular multiplication protein IcmJ